MASPKGWSALLAESRGTFIGQGAFSLPAYSEYMPPPYVGIKPYDADCEDASVQADEDAFEISEYEQAHELVPGLASVATHLLVALAKLARGGSHQMSRTLLEGNPAWPQELADAAQAGRFAAEPLLVAMPLALSRSQDDKGNVRWTLFGASHEGPSAPFWRSFSEHDTQRFERFVGWATETSSATGLRVLASPAEVPDFVKPLLLGEDEPPGELRTLVTFRPFSGLPAPLRRAYLKRRVRLVPSPASLVFFEHPRYRALAETLPRATQIPLLHLFPRSESSYGIRIPQSGWLDEAALHPTSGHRLVHHVVRSHRWQRVARDHAPALEPGFADKVSVALFSTAPDDLGLYGKPMAANAQLWRDDYQMLLDGPRATAAELALAARLVQRGGRFGYRFHYPPMRVGRRELFWHRPLVARLEPGATTASVYTDDPPQGYVLCEPRPEEDGRPRLLDRPGHREAATLFDRDVGQARHTTCGNLRKLLEFRSLLGAPLPPSVARALLHIPKNEGLDDWLAQLPALASERAAGERVAAHVRGLLAPPSEPAAPLTFDRSATRAFEERVWQTIASLAEGEFLAKESADAVLVNQGKTGGPAARAARVHVSQRRDLERLGDHLHERYRALIEGHGMTGRARIADHVFQWETIFGLPWSQGWAQNQSREAHERNIVLMIPGRDRRQAVIMADHYDTAYMEDVYESDRGGDGLRAAAAGADDNHSATSALLQAADVLLPLAREGKLARDVWLVHLTGEEFPADCLGARALAQALVERRLRLIGDDGLIDVSRVRVVGTLVLDMIGHNNPRDRDVFQIAPGEGRAAARLAARVQRANQSWNHQVERWNLAPDRADKGRAQRRDEGSQTPPPFAHLPLSGEIRPEWNPRSALYNTDGQIFSDAGIPVVLIMENYDISRTGYHDTHDTMKNIDLDYVAALTAIAIEAVASAAVDADV
jgi:hypothetical protein